MDPATSRKRTSVPGLDPTSCTACFDGSTDTLRTVWARDAKKSQPRPSATFCRPSAAGSARNNPTPQQEQLTLHERPKFKDSAPA